jgi:mono/diheme cytochrome c family protein
VGPAFKAKWTGRLTVSEAGDYRFFADADDRAGPSTIAVGGHVVGGSPVRLPAGVHDVAITYERPAGRARFSFDWASATFGREPVPAALLSHAGWPAEARRTKQIDRGRALADDLGCRLCHHRPGDEPTSPSFFDATRRGRGPGLTNAGKRLSPAWIHAWLSQPRRHGAATAARDESVKMPVLLTAGEAAHVTAFLAGLNEAGYALGSELDGLDMSVPSSQTRDEARRLFDTVGCTACHGDGAGQVPLRALGSKFTTLSLAAYLQDPEARDHSGRMPNMLLSNPEAVLLARWLMLNRDPAFEEPPPTGDAMRGKAIVRQRGCLSCHALELEGTSVLSDLRAPNWASLGQGEVEKSESVKGCLAVAPRSPAPDFRLSQRQRADLHAYLVAQATHPEVAPAPLWQLERTIASRRCNACHETTEPATHSFANKPPPLHEVGAKLRPAWIDRVVSDGGGPRIRPWMKVRMPRFRRVNKVGDLLAAASGAPLAEDEGPTGAPPVLDDRRVQEGAQYLGRGEGGLGCVTCHNFGGFDPGSATPAPDLRSAYARIRPTWFSRWLADPLRMSPGTQMPAFFADAPEDFSRPRVEAMWAALSLGGKMPVPEGVALENQHLPIVVDRDPVVTRTFLEGAPHRTIAVGFPGVSFAFDAESATLLFAWSGGFLDMKPVWVGRGGDKAVPLGKTFFTAPPGHPLRVSRDSPASPVFRGYEMEQNVPVFLYDLGALRVRERIAPARGARAPALVRTFDVQGATSDIWIATGDVAGVTTTITGARPDGPGRHRATARAGKSLRVQVTLRADRGRRAR